MCRAAIESDCRRLCQHPVEVEAGQIGAEVACDDPGQVAIDDGLERQPERAAQRIEHGAVDQGGSVIGDQRNQPGGGAVVDLAAIVAREMAERRGRPVIEVVAAGECQRTTQLVEVVVVAERGVLVEPLRRHQFGGHSLGATAGGGAVEDADPRPGIGLRRVAQGHDPEAERHPQRDITFVEVDRLDGQGRCGHHGSSCCSAGPGRSRAAPPVRRTPIIPSRAIDRSGACRRRNVLAS